MNTQTLLRNCWALTGRALAFWRYRNRPDPYQAFRLFDGWKTLATSSVSKDAKILLLPIRVASTSNLLEGLVGTGLKLDGYRVFALLDGGTLRYSENTTLGKSWAIANALSVYEQQQFCEAFAIEPRYYSDLIDHAEVRNVVRGLKDLDYTQLCELELFDVRIGFHARAALMRYLRQETIDLPENRELLFQFVLTGINTAFAVRSVVALEGITHAFVSHGIYSTWGVACDILVKLGVTVSVWGRGYAAGNFILGRDRSYLLEGIDESTEDVRQMVKGRTGGIDLDAYFREKARPGNRVDIESYYDAPPQIGDLQKKMGIDPRDHDAVVCVFPNIPWDGTIYGGSAFTPTLRVFAQEILLSAKRFPRIRFVIRTHPAERHRKGNNTREIFTSFFSSEDLATVPNVVLIRPQSPISSYALLPICDAALVFGTTLAMEIAFRGIPVLQTGIHHLSNKGVVYEIGSREELNSRLEAVLAKELHVTEVMRENMRRYAHYHINLAHVVDDMVEIDYYYFKSYKFQSLSSLRHGGLPSANAIKEFVLGKSRKCLNPYV